MRLGQRELSVIQPVLQLKLKTVKLNKTWEKLNFEMPLGKIIKGELHLSDSDLEMLRILYSKHVKTKPEIEYSAHADRISLADHRIDEKSGNGNVFGNQLWFASIGAILPLKTGDMHIAHHGVNIAVGIENLAIKQIKKLIIVENGTMLVKLQDWSKQIPMQWQDSLILYRGHGKHTKMVNQILEASPDDCLVAVYGDFDLYGLNIVNNFNSIRPVYLIAPECWKSLDEKHPDNNAFKFNDQLEYGAALLTSAGTPEALKTIVHYIKENKLAVMQENVNRLGKLTCIALN